MKLTKRQLKRIIREEYTRLKRQGLINEMDRAERRRRSNMDFVGEKGELGRNLNLSQPVPDFMVNKLCDELVRGNALDAQDGYYLLADLGCLEDHQNWCRDNDVPCDAMLDTEDVAKLMSHCGL